MPAEIGALLAEAAWLTRLARRLVRDPAEADDLVQETYVAAMRSPPEPGRPVRPWLRRVLANAARMRYRGARRRTAREEVVELAAEPVKSPDQLLERAELERRLGELVLALAEPFRSTVLLRFREGLTAEAIAEQQGIPASTVRTRLKTALDRLRDGLEEHETQRWRALLAPAGLPLKGLVMAKVGSKSATLVVLLLLLVLAGGGLAVWRARAPGADESRGASGELETTANVASRAAASDPTTRFDPSVLAGPDSPRRRLGGRVTLDGAAFRGAAMRLVHAETALVVGEATSGTDGRFDFGERVADRYRVVASAPGSIAEPVLVDLRATTDVELRLAGCMRLRGTITDGTGAPITGARVARSEAPWPVAESDAEGRYELCTRFGNAWIEYSATGFHGAVLRMALDELTTRDVVLVPEAVIAGRILRDDDSPVADAWIVIDPRDKGPVRNRPSRAASAGDGSFRIAGVAPGRNFVKVTAPGLLAPHPLEIVVGAGEVREDVVIRVGRAARVTGTVVGGDRPVAGAEVGFRVGNLDERGPVATTDPEGRFTIDRVPRGALALYVSGYTVLSPRALTVQADRVDVRVEVDALGGVRGRVVAASSGPVRDALVECGPHEAKVEPGGTFECHGLAAGLHTLVARTADGRWGLTDVRVERGVYATANIELTSAATICGSVVDEGARPVRGIELQVSEVTTGDFGRDVTGEDGRFCARWLTGRGRYAVTLFAGGQRLEVRSGPRLVELATAEARPDVRFVVAIAPLTIAGDVRDSAGRPVADAIVRVHAADRLGVHTLDASSPRSIAVTDGAGHFEIARLAAGTYVVLATGRDGSERLVHDVPAGRLDLEITLDPAGAIDGTLEGFSAPPTITGVLMSAAHEPIDAQVEGTRFRATGLSPGTYVLMAVNDAHEGDTREVVVRAGETSKATLASRGIATLAVTVRDWRTRVPMPGLRCHSVARENITIGAIYVGPDVGVAADARGELRMQGPAGDIVVFCDAPSADHGGVRLATARVGEVTRVEVLALARRHEAGRIGARLAYLENRVEELVRGGPAERAGLAIGDVIVAVDGVSVAELVGRHTLAVIQERPHGTPARVTIQRGSERRELSILVASP